MNAFVVGYSSNYLPGFNALRNSIQKYAPTAYLYSFQNESVQGTAIERFRIASEIAPDYDAICLLDADMFLTANVDLFFELASKGYIVTGSNGMIIDFNKEYQARYEVDLGCESYPYTKIHTTVPIFISKADTDWFDALYNSRRIDSFDDFLYLNILGIKMGKDKKMIQIPASQCTNIHHWMVKPETSIRVMGDKLLNGSEEQIYMIHGKLWDEGYINDLWLVMSKYLDDWQMGSKCQERTKDAISILKQQFENLK